MAKTACSFVQFPPGSAEFYISEHYSENSLAYWLTDDSDPDSKPKRTKLDEAASIQPIAFTHNEDGFIYCFYVTDGGRLTCYRLTSDGFGKLTINGRFTLQRQDGTSFKDIKNNNTNEKRFGATQVPGGILATYYNGSGVEMSFYELENRPDENGDWQPEASHPLPSNITKVHSSTVIADLTPVVGDGGLRLIVADLVDGKINIHESILIKDHEPKGFDDPTFGSYTHETTFSKITSKYPLLHTGPDGRAYLSYYVPYTVDKEDDASNPCFAVRTTTYSDPGARESVNNGPTGVSWVESGVGTLGPEINDKALKNISKGSAPTANYEVIGESAKTTAKLGEDTVTNASVRIDRVINILSNSSTKKGHGFFGNALRIPLGESEQTSKGVIVGYTEGPPPLPYQNLSLDIGVRPDPKSSVDIEFTDTQLNGATISSNTSFVMKSEGKLGSGGKLADTTVYAGIAFEFSMEIGFKEVATKLTGVTTNVVLGQSYDNQDFGFISTERAAQIGAPASLVGSEENGDRTLWPPGVGTIFLQTMAVTGVAYRFLPAGAKLEDDLNPDIPSIVVYAPSTVEVRAVDYFLNPSKPVPGNLATYTAEQENIWWAGLDDSTQFAGKQEPYLAWSNTGNARQWRTAFSQKDNANTTFTDITALVGVFLEAQGPGFKTEFKLLTGTNLNFSTETFDSERRSLSVVTEISLHSDLNNPDVYQGFTGHTHFLAPEGLDNKKKVIENLRDNLLWQDDKVKDDDEEQTEEQRKYSTFVKAQWARNQEVMDMIDWGVNSAVERVTDTAANPFAITQLVDHLDPERGFNIETPAVVGNGTEEDPEIPATTYRS